jgi:hypothetical protein
VYLQKLNAILSVKHVPEWFPGAGFKRQAREWRAVADAMLNEPFELTKKAMVTRGSTERDVSSADI